MPTYSPTGWLAVFRSTDDGHDVAPVERFDDEGQALVVEPSYGRLIPAAGQDTFDGLVPCPLPPTAIPASPGWETFGTDTDGNPWSDPVAAWLVDNTGHAWPLVATPRAQHLWRLDYLADDQYEIRGPRSANAEDAVEA